VRHLSLKGHVAPPSFAPWCQMPPVFFCATFMAGSPGLSVAFTSSLPKARSRSPDGRQRRAVYSVRFIRLKPWVSGLTTAAGPLPLIAHMRTYP
jgi:hypothetical protein